MILSNFVIEHIKNNVAERDLDVISNNILISLKLNLLISNLLVNNLINAHVFYVYFKTRGLKERNRTS